jgi:hypothetical protein
LGQIPEELQNIIQNTADAKHLEIINVYDLTDPRCAGIGPSEFVYLVDHAQMVYTDSFHGTVFSILMNKPFFVINRVEKGMENMSSRIDTLLDLFHMQDRYLKPEDHYQYQGERKFNMDFRCVGEIQKHEQAKLEAYIRMLLHRSSKAYESA